MSNKILIAVDPSENALKAVAYAAGILPKDARITIYHVFFKHPPKEIDSEDPFLLHQISFQERIEEAKKWLAQEKAVIEQAMDKARDLLIKGGIESDCIDLKIEERKESVARDILSELEKGEYDTVIVGRRGLSGAKGFFVGSVSSKILHHAKNCAVWVVE
jgi:nucleotide-binding universal stress UspA family protein